MFVKPSSALVGKPSVVASSSGSAKYARYARLFPSTRKSSESRAGASSRSSSTPVRVLGLTCTTLSSGGVGAFGHIDLRVSALAEAQAFYDALLPALGFSERYHGELWKVWATPDPPPGAVYFAVT